MKTRIALLGAVALGALALGTQPANATFYVFYSVDGGTNYNQFMTGADNTTISAASPVLTGVASGVRFGASVFSNNAPNAAGLVPSFTDTTQTTVQNTTGAQQTINFAIIDNNFQGPLAGPLTLNNGITLYDNAGVVGSTISQFSCIQDNGNTPAAGSISSFCNTAAAKTPNASLSTTSVPSFASGTSTTGTVGTLTSPFSLAEFLTLSLAPGANLTAGGNATVSTSSTTGTSSNPSTVPEPVSMSLLGVGLIGLGVARMRRKA